MGVHVNVLVAGSNVAPVGNPVALYVSESPSGSVAEMTKLRFCVAPTLLLAVKTGG